MFSFKLFNYLGRVSTAEFLSIVDFQFEKITNQISEFKRTIKMIYDIFSYQLLNLNYLDGMSTRGILSVSART